MTYHDAELQDAYHRNQVTIEHVIRVLCWHNLGSTPNPHRLQCLFADPESASVPGLVSQMLRRSRHIIHVRK
eukprot:1646637-Alexandrium_andersonii.AAC.1